MPQRRISISNKKLNELMASPQIRQKLQNKANRILPRAKALAYADGQTEFGKALSTTTGIRSGIKSPTGLRRPYARIGAQITPEMKKADGYTKTTRQQLLRKARDG